MSHNSHQLPLTSTLFISSDKGWWDERVIKQEKYRNYSNKRPGVYYKHCLLVERGWAFIRGITCP